MLTRIQVLALGMVLVLVTSVGGAQIGIAPNTAPTSDNPVANPTDDTEASSANATMIESCSVINESGHYELAANLSGHGHKECIDIRASDVVLDGNGHTIDAFEAEGVRVNGTESQHNVTVRNLRIHGLIGASSGTTGITVENASEITLANVTVEDAYFGIDVQESSDVAIRNVTVSGEESTHGSSGAGIGSSHSTNVTIVDSTVRTVQVNVFANGQNVTVRNNTIYQTYLAGSAGLLGTGISISASDSEIVGNDVIAPSSDVERQSVSGDGIKLFGNTSNTRVAENVITFGGRSGISINTTGTDNTSNVIANNTIESTVIGVYVVQNSNPLSVEHNEFSSTKKGIRIGHQEGCYLAGANADTVAAHHNSFEGSPIGVDNIDDSVLNATQNYWGATNGPSSANDTDAPFEDPETGTLADGDGASVSEDPNEDGVSNVHFDTWLDEPPADAGASGDDDDTESN